MSVTVRIILAVVVVGMSGVFLLMRKTSSEVVSDLKVSNPEGDEGIALVVYHPGLSNFQRQVNYAFADGLVSHGWRTEITTASSQAPTDLSGYDLLVLGGPVYAGAVAQPVVSYLSGLGDLGGKRTVLIISGAGKTDEAVSVMEKLVQDANGDLVKSLPIWTQAPNEEMYGISDPEEIMRQAGTEISLPD